MKKTLKKLFALVLVLSMAFCFAACEDKKEVTKEVTKEIDKGAEEEIEAYLALQQEELDEVIEGLRQQGIETKIYAEDSSLVYEYTFGFDVPEDSIEAFDEGIQASKAELSSSSEIVFNECASVEEIVYVYYDIDGTKLSEVSIDR